MAIQEERMRENEELFRTLDERLLLGHAVDEGEVVVREVGSQHVVRQEAA